MTNHRHAPRADSAVWGIVAAVALILIGVFAPAWPVLVFGGVVLIVAIIALAIANRTAAEHPPAVRVHIDGAGVARAVRDYERGLP